MDQETIKTLIDAMSSSDLAEMEFKEGGWTLRLVRGAGQGGVPPAQTVATSPSRIRRDIPVARSKAVGDSGETDVTSPMFGVVYLRPSPDAPEFVTPGSTVKAGVTLCVVEAMKVFNEIKARRDGTVASILVTSGDEVEAGQPLMILA
ncbi:MAG: biotin/lipoyl-binding protein [Burkholderiales bacterium]|nr:biotin/lipoyl-binding protein [Burkholderiales bacterium]